jgi:CDP-diacylglycerol--serine O-phosphatidyltransferase
VADWSGRTRPAQPRRFRRGIYLLPSIFTVGNMFCGYACVVLAGRGDVEMAAPFIGAAFVLDSLDGSIARLTGTQSAFGVQLDSLADVISFGLAPAILAFVWGLADFGRAGWAAGFMFTSCAAMRLARFNIQSSSQLDKRYFVGMPSPAAGSVIAATVFLWPTAITGNIQPVRGLIEAGALAVVLVPAILMVSTVRFRSFKAINFGWRRSPKALLAFVVAMVFLVAEPALTLVIMAYGYLVSAFIGMLITRLRRPAALPPGPPAATSP